MEPVHLSDNSYILITKLPESVIVDFDTLWNMHPKDRGELNIYGKKVTVSRYFKTYGKNYSFSGIKAQADPIPEILEPFLNYANELMKTTESFKIFKTAPQEIFNGILINWYPNGLSYISAHSDSEKDIAKGHPILSISLGAERKFRFRNKNKEIVKDIQMPDRTVIVMCGQTQSYFTHEVPKITGTLGENTGPRINITFRHFIN